MGPHMGTQIDPHMGHMGPNKEPMWLHIEPHRGSHGGNVWVPYGAQYGMSPEKNNNNVSGKNHGTALASDFSESASKRFVFGDVMLTPRIVMTHKDS